MALELHNLEQASCAKVAFVRFFAVVFLYDILTLLEGESSQGKTSVEEARKKIFLVDSQVIIVFFPVNNCKILMKKFRISFC